MYMCTVFGGHKIISAQPNAYNTKQIYLVQSHNVHIVLHIFKTRNKLFKNLVHRYMQDIVEI